MRPKTPSLNTIWATHSFDESYFGEAFNAYKSATMNAKTKAEKHSALHNMGNVFMNQKDYAKAVETYKEALRNNPNDDQNSIQLCFGQRIARERTAKPRSNQDQRPRQQRPTESRPTKQR